VTEDTTTLVKSFVEWCDKLLVLEKSLNKNKVFAGRNSGSSGVGFSGVKHDAACWLLGCLSPRSAEYVNAPLLALDLIRGSNSWCDVRGVTEFFNPWVFRIELSWDCGLGSTELVVGLWGEGLSVRTGGFFEFVYWDELA
jgi:hypothetical protein